MSIETLVKTRSTFVNGAWQEGLGSSTITAINPSDGSEISRVQTSSREQVEGAITAARAAFESSGWRSFGPSDRSALLYAVADAIERNSEELAQLIALEIGSPISYARGMQLANPVEVFKWYAEAALRGPYGTYDRELGLYSNPVPSLSRLVSEPVGVVAVLPAFNYPINLVAWKLGGVLASGCTAVIAPSPKASLTTIRLIEILEQEVELPVGVVNLVVGGPEVGASLSSSPEVDLITFTGSDVVGSKIMEQAAPNLAKLILELGGKAANIVLPGADLATAVPQAVIRFARNAGQGCGAWTRILVHENDYERFVASASECISSLSVGRASDESTQVGPLVSAAHRDWVQSQIDAAINDGASVVAGGTELDRSLAAGAFLAPTLLAGLTFDHPLCMKELFAPVSILIPYHDLDEAVSVANASPFALNANISGDLDTALELATRLRVGTVTINNGSGQRPDGPWGGGKRSGIGRELGDEGFAAFFETKHIQWAI